jgi:hypothetical protein
MTYVVEDSGLRRKGIVVEWKNLPVDACEVVNGEEATEVKCKRGESSRFKDEKVKREGIEKVEVSKCKGTKEGESVNVGKEGVEK